MKNGANNEKTPAVAAGAQELLDKSGGPHIWAPNPRGTCPGGTCPDEAISLRKGEHLKTRFFGAHHLESLSPESVWSLLRQSHETDPLRPQNPQFVPKLPGTQRLPGARFSPGHWYGSFWAILDKTTKVQKQVICDYRFYNISKTLLIKKIDTPLGRVSLNVVCQQTGTSCVLMCWGFPWKQKNLEPALLWSAQQGAQPPNRSFALFLVGPQRDHFPSKSSCKHSSYQGLGKKMQENHSPTHPPCRGIHTKQGK